jgi:hypothetical protein
LIKRLRTGGLLMMISEKTLTTKCMGSAPDRMQRMLAG